MNWAVALWAWLCGVAACTLASAWLAPSRDLALAAALAAAPALGGFVLLPALGRRRVALGLLALWLAASIGLVAGTGGAASPLAIMLAAPAAIAAALRRAWAPEAGAASALGYALAAWLGQAPFAEGAVLSPFPETLAVVAIAFISGMIALGVGASAPAAASNARIAEVSHELRTPLTHILGFAEMIERRIFGELPDRYAEYAGLIRKSGAHLLSLVNDLLDLSRIQAGRFAIERERFDVRAIVEEVVRLNADAAAARNIALGMITPETPLMANLDPRALRRMLINTVGNALKFTPDEGRVMVRAESRQGWVVLETIDSGPGIPDAERASLGQPYVRGAGARDVEGTGLGLALVRGLAEVHGGELTLHEAPGGGALVRITLPKDAV